MQSITNTYRCEVLATKGLYDCECTRDAANFPPINFYFENSNTPFQLTGAQYTYIYDKSFITGQKNCLLLFRKNAQFKMDISTDPYQNRLFLGTSFMKAHYTQFNTKDNTISIAPAFNVPAQTKFIDGNSRLLFIGLGALLVVAGLIALLSIIPKVSYVP